jgi:hypothetical protein
MPTIRFHPVDVTVTTKRDLCTISLEEALQVPEGRKKVTTAEIWWPGPPQ